MVELAGEECVVAIHAAVVGRGDEGSCGISALVLTRATHKPPIE
jgi:hypothetical protein